MQAIDQSVDLATVGFEEGVEPLIAIEPTAQGSIHFVGTLSNVWRRLRGLIDTPQDGSGFDQRSRILGRAPARKFRERVTQTLGFIEIHGGTDYLRQSSAAKPYWSAMPGYQPLRATKSFGSVIWRISRNARRLSAACW